jgi:putative DNA methylase
MMAIPVNCKRLVEVDFPMVAVSEASSEEKNIAIGSFAATHVWWARRPLAACRAMNLACMIPDPADSNCPTDLRKIIANALDELHRAPGGQIKLTVTKNNWSQKEDGDLSASRNRPATLRRRLLKFIGEYSQWDLKMNDDYTKCARKIITGCNEGNPILLDSFAGGGSIPLEGIRVGLSSIATDINPIPILLNKLQLEYLPTINVEAYLKKARLEAERINSILSDEISEYFPLHRFQGVEEIPSGYLCARTVICEGIGCGLEIPLIPSSWVSKSKHNKVAYSFSKNNEKVSIDLIYNPQSNEITEQTCKGGNAKCPICNHVTPVKSVRKQLSSRQGGTMDSRLVAIVSSKNGKGRIYRTPNKEDILARESAKQAVIDFLSKNPELSIPNESLPPQGSLGTRVQGYGVEKWSDLFTPRQTLAILVLSREVKNIKDPIVRLILAFTVSKFTDRNSSLSTWMVTRESYNQTFKSHRLQMAWDFYEQRPFGNIGTNFMSTFTGISRGILSARVPNDSLTGKSIFSDATNHILPDDSIDLWAVDPPYYDSVPYSDISNYFVVWLKRILPIDNIILENGISPKKTELIMDNSISGGVKKNKDWYENSVTSALSEGQRVTKDSGISYWVYAHKSTEGWATVLKGITNSGWKVTASWPISTERTKRMRALDSAALSTSVHIVMRPRGESAGVGQWSEILNQLPDKLSKWLTRMKQSKVMGADAIYSCIGPAMELFSKYDSVERASGEEVNIDEYLQYVWDTVADEAVKLLIPDSKHSTAEPEARFSMMAIWTLRQSENVDYLSGESLDEGEVEVVAEPSKLTIPFDTASLLARGIGAVIEDLERSEIIDIKGGNVKILSPEDRRHYLLGFTNGDSKVQLKDSGSFQMKLGESSEEAEARVGVETKQKGFIEMPKRDSQLDKLHQAMLLHADGNSVALEAHLRDNIGDDPAVWQFANTLNTLFPEESWERSKIEGVIARYQSLR